MEPLYKKLIRTAMLQSYEPNARNSHQPSGTLNHEKLEKKLQDIVEMQMKAPTVKDWAGFYDTPLKQLQQPKGMPFLNISQRKK
jgi:hypothetical protein